MPSLSRLEIGKWKLESGKLKSESGKWKLETRNGMAPLVHGRKRLFAASFLTHDMPHYWNVVTSFANQDASGTKQGVTAEAKLILENMKILYSDAFSVDVLPMSHVGQ